MAIRWIGALVEPPMAELTTMAFIEGCAREDVRGLEVLAHHLDGAACRSRRPSARARGRAREWRRSRAATCPAPRPARSCVEAVPMVLQWPSRGRRVERGLQEIRSRRSCPPPRARGALRRRWCRGRAARLSLQPLSIGPPDSTMAGMSTVAAAISSAGVVLSRPVVSTTPSSG